MKNVKQLLSVALCSSVVFFSPGFSCYQALAAGVAEVRIDGAGPAGMALGMQTGALNMAGTELPGMDMNGIGRIENFENAALSNQEAPAERTAPIAAQAQPESAAPKSEDISQADGKETAAQTRPDPASLALSARMTDSLSSRPRKTLRQRIAGAVAALKTLVRGVKGAPQCKSEDTMAQYDAGKKMFDRAVFLGTPVLAGLPLLHAAGPEAVATLLGAKNLPADRGAQTGQNIPTPARVARVYPAASWWKESAQSLARRLVKILDLPSKNRAGKIWSFTLSQDNGHHPIPETSVLFSQPYRDGYAYSYDKEIAARMGMDFYSFMTLDDGVGYIEIRTESVQDAAKIAKDLAAIPLVTGVFVNPAVLNEIKKEPSVVKATSKKGLATAVRMGIVVLGLALLAAAPAHATSLIAATTASHPVLWSLGGAALLGIMGALIFGRMGAKRGDKTGDGFSGILGMEAGLIFGGLGGAIAGTLLGLLISGVI